MLGTLLKSFRQDPAGWTSRRLGPFGDVVAVEFDRPESR